MNRYRMQFAPRVWKPKLSPLVVACSRPWRRRFQHRSEQLVQTDFVGTEHVRDAIGSGAGVMIMPNHSSHADPFTIYAAADELKTPLHIMATWHVFADKAWMTQRLLQAHGCFSVDREANDVGAFKEAVNILQTKKQPLVIFPEGEIYHCNARVTPFREGAAAIGIAAARRAKRPVLAVPCSIYYRYLEDPTESLLATMGQLEERALWRRQSHLPLQERIYRFAEALLALKELEYMKQVQAGGLPERIAQLGDYILDAVERRHGITESNGNIPERVKELRRTIIAAMSDEQSPPNDQQRQQLYDDLADVFIVVQSFSYPGDYVLQDPTIERMAETIDKFEEDVLQLPTASIRAPRRVEVRFGEPVEISADRRAKRQSGQLTQQVEDAVQSLLDQSVAIS